MRANAVQPGRILWIGDSTSVRWRSSVGVIYVSDQEGGRLTDGAGVADLSLADPYDGFFVAEVHLNFPPCQEHVDELLDQHGQGGGDQQRGLAIEQAAAFAHGMARGLLLRGWRGAGG